MRIFPFVKKFSTLDKSKFMIISIPYEGYVNSRLGTFYAPKFIRTYSECIETYSNYFNRSLEEVDYFDIGDIKISHSLNNDETIGELYNTLKSIVVSKEKRYIFIGGDHSITIACFWALKSLYKNLIYIHLDAHADCHNLYCGQKYSHASVLRRISEENVCISVGVRTWDDFEKSYFFSRIINIELNNLDKLLDYVRGYVYLSVDMDFFDPSISCAVSNPNSNGATFQDYIKILNILSNERVVGFDVVELNPLLDYPSFKTTILAAEVIREFMLSSR